MSDMRTIRHDFERELERGRFSIPLCTGCHKTVWPPANFCDSCMCVVLLETHVDNYNNHKMHGRIIESVSHAAPTADSIGNAPSGKNLFLCMVEFECGIRVIARMSHGTEPNPGDRITLKACGLDRAESCYVFEVSPASPAKT